MESSFCSFCSSVIELGSSRPCKGGRVCTKCQWKTSPKYLVKGCKTPRRKQNPLRSLPTQVTELAPGARLQLNLAFGLTADTAECCSSCYVKLHRAASQVPQMSTVQVVPKQLPTFFLKRGRPPTPYEQASKRTQPKIEKEAKKVQSNLKGELMSKLDDLSNGSGSMLYKKVADANNMPEGQKVEKLVKRLEILFFPDTHHI